jgi:hypothetical protein
MARTPRRKQAGSQSATLTHLQRGVILSAVRIRGCFSAQ